VHWSGYFAEVKRRQTGVILFGSDHHLSILVKMSPSESEIFADLVLSLSTIQYERQKSMFDSLQKGDEISFDAIIVNMGGEFKMHHLHAKGDIEKTGANTDIGKIVVKESALP